MLARQLLIGFLAVIVPSTTLVGAVTLYSLAAMDRVRNELAEISHSDEAVTDLNMTLTRASAALDAFRLGEGARNRQTFEELIRVAEAKLESCGAAPCHGSSQTPARMAARLMPAVERLKRDGRPIFDNGTGNGAARVEAVRAIVASVRGTLEPMLLAVHVRAGALHAEADDVLRRAWLLTLALTGAVVLAGAAAAMVIAGRISRPLHDLLFGIRRVMAGDWDYQARSDRRGEIGELASAFNAMVREVHEHRLVQSEKLASLGLLAAGVAHELNNPLTSIVMNASLMTEEVSPGTPLHEALKRIDADAARCQRIIEDLKAFARVPQVERVPGEVGAVVEQALAAAARDLDRRRVVVWRDLDPGLPKITWDPQRMVQVMTNLLVNAAQAPGDGPRHVLVRARRDGNVVRLEVEDDGGGIPAQHRPRIFDPFFTTKPDGTGLGLSISHGIVNEHGGRIEVESRTREEVGPDGTTGTVVRVLLPIGEATG